MSPESCHRQMLINENVNWLWQFFSFPFKWPSEILSISCFSQIIFWPSDFHLNLPSSVIEVKKAAQIGLYCKLHSMFVVATAVAYVVAVAEPVTWSLLLLLLLFRLVLQLVVAVAVVLTLFTLKGPGGWRVKKSLTLKQLLFVLSNSLIRNVSHSMIRQEELSSDSQQTTTTTATTAVATSATPAVATLRSGSISFFPTGISRDKKGLRCEKM